MAILSACCCWRSIRRGSFASGFYTLTYYLLLVVGGTFQVESGTPQTSNSTVSSTPSSSAPLSFTIAVLASSGTTVFASVILLVGLCVDNRLFLLPWIISVTINTIICSAYSLYLVATMPFDPLLAVIFTMDFFISVLNIYCLLCVISQYQEYKAGRGRAEDEAALYQPPVKYEPWGSSYPTKKLVTFQENGRPAPCLASKLGGRCLEARTLLAKDDSNQRRHRIHFQDAAESSTTSDDRGSGLPVPVANDSPSTDTTSSRLQSEASTALPSPKPKRVQFSTDVIANDYNNANASPATSGSDPATPPSGSMRSDAGKTTEEMESKFASPTNESSPLIESQLKVK